MTHAIGRVFNSTQLFLSPPLITAIWVSAIESGASPLMTTTLMRVSRTRLDIPPTRTFISLGLCHFQRQGKRTNERRGCCWGFNSTFTIFLLDFCFPPLTAPRCMVFRMENHGPILLFFLVSSAFLSFFPFRGFPEHCICKRLRGGAGKRGRGARECVCGVAEGGGRRGRRRRWAAWNRNYNDERGQEGGREGLGFPKIGRLRKTAGWLLGSLSNPPTLPFRPPRQVEGEVV